MLRIICRLDDAAMAANVGGSVFTKFKTFDVDLPEVEAHLIESAKEGGIYVHCQVTGVEIINAASIRKDRE